MGHHETTQVLAFVGLDGTGKTSVANDLAATDENIAVFHPDELLRDFTLHTGIEPISRIEYLDWQKNLLKQNPNAFNTPISDLLKNHGTVILDGPFLSLTALRRFRAALDIVPFEARAAIRFLRVAAPFSSTSLAGTHLRSFSAFQASDNPVESSIFRRVMNAGSIFERPIDTSTVEKDVVTARIREVVKARQRAA